MPNPSFLKRALLAGLAAAAPALAAEPELSYPELTVAPRASERIESEAAREPDERWVHLPIEIPAAMTLATSLYLIADGDQSQPGRERSSARPWLGVGVGAAWIAYAEFILRGDPPYARAATEIRGMSAKTTREQIVRERRSEELLMGAARVARRARWVSAVTTLATGIYLANSARDGSVGKAMGAMTAVSALVPVLFSHSWERVARSQMEYKRRIYGPVASVALLERGSALVPGLVLSARF